MQCLLLMLLSIILLLLLSCCLSNSDKELEALLEIKASLDPHNAHLSSWTKEAGHPCSNATTIAAFEGVACDEGGHVVVNISLQGRGLTGSLSPAIGQLRSLTGLYLHFNALTGHIPKEIGNLTRLTDLYLNVNNFTGSIPHQIVTMSSLQVALQYNQLSGAIPASLGDLRMLTRLDLSFNNLFGSIPVKLADAPMLKALDVQNNSLSGNVPLALKRLNSSFKYQNNPGLCGVGFASLRGCTASDDLNPDKPEPFATGTGQFARKDIPESANFQGDCNHGSCSIPTKHLHGGVIVGVVVLMGGAAVLGLFVFSWHRRHKQKIGNAFDACDSRFSTDQAKEVCRRSASPLINLEYSSSWDPLGKVPQEVMQSSLFNLDDVESATQHFAEINLLGKGVGYVHAQQGTKATLVHRNLSAEKVLIDSSMNSLLAGTGLHKLLADDIVFLALKSSAAMGYLAPEYTTTGKFTEKSDIYAFGMIMLQILTGKSKISHLSRCGAESGRLEDFVDANLDGKFSAPEAAKLGKIASLCTCEIPSQRPSMESVIQELLPLGGSS